MLQKPKASIFSFYWPGLHIAIAQNKYISLFHFRPPLPIPI